MKRSTIVLLAAALLVGCGSAEAQDFTSTHTDCGALQLYAAAGVPHAEAHKYRFHGICRELEKNDDEEVVSVRWEGWVEIESRYDGKTAEFDEAVKVTMSGQYDGPSSGTIKLGLKCAQDPMLPSPTASAVSSALMPVSCTIMQSAMTTTWPDFVQAWKKGMPFTKGKVTYAQAVALSQQVASNTPPPPPPPPPTSKPKQPLQDASRAMAAAPPARASKPATTSATNDRMRARPRPPLEVPPPPAELTELALAANARIPLQSGRSLAAQPLDGSLRWTILGESGEVMRTFPDGSRAYRNSKREILVDWGGGTFNAGLARPAQRLTLPQ